MSMTDDARVRRAILRIQGAAGLPLTAAAAMLAKAGLSGDRPLRQDNRRHCFPRNGKLHKIVLLLYQGCCDREIRRQTGSHSTTVAKIRAIQEKFIGEPILCPCGRPANHRGWCRERLKRSPKRRAFLGAWGRQPTITTHDHPIT